MRALVLAAALLSVTGCKASDDAVEQLRAVRLQNTDVCLIITGAGRDRGGVAMLRVPCDDLDHNYVVTVAPERYEP